MTIEELREQVCHANKMLPATGLVTMHSGNASGLDRGSGRLVIKPSGVGYETLSPGNPAKTFGAYGWCRIPNLQRLSRDVLLRHFPHHVAITQSHVGNILWEAFGNYLGMNAYHGAQETPGSYTPRLPF